MAKLLDAYSKVHFWSEGSSAAADSSSSVESNLDLLQEDSGASTDQQVFFPSWSANWRSVVDNVNASSTSSNSSSFPASAFGNATESLNLVHIQVALNLMTAIFFLYIAYLALGLSNSEGSEERNVDGPVNIKVEESVGGKSAGGKNRSFLNRRRLLLSGHCSGNGGSSTQPKM